MSITLTINTLERNDENGEIMWHDKDEIMLHTCFQLLVDYWEKEYPECPFVLTEEYDELKQLYQWWLQRPNRELPEIEIPDDYMMTEPIEIENGEIAYKFLGWNKAKYPEVAKVDEIQGKLIEKWDKEDQQNLERLIQLRELLWT